MLTAKPLVAILAAGLALASPGNPSYTVLDARAEPLKAAFNADAGKVRLFMYVAPTCGGCLRGAKQLQETLLENYASANLSVYVVWVQKNGARMRHVEKVTGLVTDPRAEHYWDEADALVGPIDGLLGLTGPCAGAFMIYGPDARWEGAAPPAPLYWEDAHTNDLGRTVAPQFDAKEITRRVDALLR